MKFKKFIFTTVLTIIVYSVPAQTEKIQFSIQAGLNNSAGIVNDAHEIRFRTGYHIGGLVNYSFISKFSLQTGLLLTEKGGKFVGLNSGNYIGGTPDYKHVFKALYLKVPFSVIYIKKITEKLNVMFGVGTYFAYGISGKSRIDVNGVYLDGTNFRKWNTFIIDSRYVDESLKRFDTGIILNCQLEYNKIFLGIGLEKGLLNTLREYEGYGQDLKFYNLNIPISIGYRF